MQTIHHLQLFGIWTHQTGDIQGRWHLNLGVSRRRMMRKKPMMSLGKLLIYSTKTNQVRVFPFFVFNIFHMYFVCIMSSFFSFFRCIVYLCFLFSFCNPLFVMLGYIDQGEFKDAMRSLPTNIKKITLASWCFSLLRQIHRSMWHARQAWKWFPDRNLSLKETISK